MKDPDPRHWLVKNDLPESEPEMDHCNEGVLYDAAEELGGDVELLVRILGEELVLLKQVLHIRGGTVCSITLIHFLKTFINQSN
jgi:hypothetical protein